jgi:hypothetical protein
MDELTEIVGAEYAEQPGNEQYKSGLKQHAILQSCDYEDGGPTTQLPAAECRCTLGLWKIISKDVRARSPQAKSAGRRRAFLGRS